MSAAHHLIGSPIDPIGSLSSIAVVAIVAVTRESSESTGWTPNVIEFVTGPIQV